MNKLFLPASVLFSIIIAFSACQHFPLKGGQTAPKHPAIIQVTYTDTMGTQLHAQFDNLQHQVTLTLAEQKVTLPKVVSASGIKYASGVEVFWSKGTNAVYKSGGVILFKGTNQ